MSEETTVQAEPQTLEEAMEQIEKRKAAGRDRAELEKTAKAERRRLAKEAGEYLLGNGWKLMYADPISIAYRVEGDMAKFIWTVRSKRDEFSSKEARIVLAKKAQEAPDNFLLVPAPENTSFEAMSRFRLSVLYTLADAVENVDEIAKQVPNYFRRVTPDILTFESSLTDLKLLTLMRERALETAASAADRIASRLGLRVSVP